MNNPAVWPSNGEMVDGGGERHRQVASVGSRQSRGGQNLEPRERVVRWKSGRILMESWGTTGEGPRHLPNGWKSGSRSLRESSEGRRRARTEQVPPRQVPFRCIPSPSFPEGGHAAANLVPNPLVLLTGESGRAPAEVGTCSVRFLFCHLHSSRKRSHLRIVFGQLEPRDTVAAPAGEWKGPVDLARSRRRIKASPTKPDKR